MTRFRVLVISGALLLGFTFNGCFDGGGEPCKHLQAAAAGGPSIPCET